CYVLGNILRSTRYGAISSRIGKVKNILAGVVFSDTELFSNLELTQAVFDALRGDEDEPTFPIGSNAVVEATRRATEQLLTRVVGQVTVLSEDEVASLINDMIALYRDGDRVKSLLDATDKAYPQNKGQSKAKTKAKTKARKKKS
ncbi:MAG: type I-D CRISPR-associated protein Cas7/Csc2, partial [Ardenticatenaceae bacterium]